MRAVKDYFRSMKKGVLLNLLVQLNINLGLGFAAYYFKIHGTEMYKIILIWALSPLVSLPVVYFPKTWNIRKNLSYGLLGYTGMALSLLFLNEYSFLLFAISSGLTLGFFWVSCNYIFFLNSNDSRYAKDSAIYFILGPFIGILLPPLGSLLIDNVGYRALFLMSVLLSLLPFLYIKDKDFDVRVENSFSEARQAFKGLRLITMLDAALHFFQGHFLAIYALLYIKSEYQVGGLLSYLALISLAASFLVSYWSDRYKKRVEILYPLLILMSVTMLVMPSAKSLAALLPLIGLYAILDNLSLPIRFAVPMDFVKMDISFWRASEFYGNVGRTIVFLIATLLLYFGSAWLAFTFFALLTFLIPFIINYKVKTHFQEK